MEQKSTVEGRSTGRPEGFDRDAVVEAAIAAFWDDGLDGTSIVDLETATGVARSTMYNSFGGKIGLYQLATGRYLERGQQGQFEPLFVGTGDGLGDIVESLERLKTALTSDGSRPGCLIVNDMTGSPEHRASDRYQQLLNDGLRAALGRSGIPPDQSEQRAQLIAATIIGINLMSRSGQHRRAIELATDALIAQVEQWRSS